MLEARRHEKMGIGNLERVNLKSIDSQYAEYVKLLSLKPVRGCCVW